MPSFPGDKSKTAPKLFEFPAIGSTGASKSTGFTLGAPPAAPASVPGPAPKVLVSAPASATSTGGFKFDLPPTAEPPKSAFPFGVTPTPVPTPVEPKPPSTPFIFGAPPQAVPTATSSTIAPATPSPDKRSGFPFIAPASTTPAETPSKPQPLFGVTPGTVTPTNKPFSLFNAPSSAAPDEADSSPIKADSVPGFPFASAPTAPAAAVTPFTFGAQPGSNPGPDSRASTPAASATGGFTFTLPGVTGVQPINNPFANKSAAATNGTSTAFSFNNPSTPTATPTKQFTFGAVPSTTPAGAPSSSSAPFQFGAPPSAATAPFGAYSAGAGTSATKKPVLQLDIDMDKDGATPPQEPARSNIPFTFGAPPAASNGFGSAPSSAHPFAQAAPSSPFNAPRSATPFGAAPSTKAPFSQLPAAPSSSNGGFNFGVPTSSVSTPVTGAFPNLRAQTSSPAASPFNPPTQLFGAPAPGTPTSFPSNLSEAGSDVGERRIKPLPKSRKPRTQSETRNALAKARHHQ